MSSYGSKLLLRRICMTRNVRISLESPRDSGLWTLHAVEEGEKRAWHIQGGTLDAVARALARHVGMELPSDQLREASASHCLSDPAAWRGRAINADEPPHERKGPLAGSRWRNS